MLRINRFVFALPKYFSSAKTPQASLGTRPPSEISRFWRKDNISTVDLISEINTKFFQTNRPSKPVEPVSRSLVVFSSYSNLINRLKSKTAQRQFNKHFEQLIILTQSKLVIRDITSQLTAIKTLTPEISSAITQLVVNFYSCLFRYGSSVIRERKKSTTTWSIDYFQSSLITVHHDFQSLVMLAQLNKLINAVTILKGYYVFVDLFPKDKSENIRRDKKMFTYLMGNMITQHAEEASLNKNGEVFLISKENIHNMAQNLRADTIALYKKVGEQLPQTFNESNLIALNSNYYSFGKSMLLTSHMEKTLLKFLATVTQEFPLNTGVHLKRLMDYALVLRVINAKDIQLKYPKLYNRIKNNPQDFFGSARQLIRAGFLEPNFIKKYLAYLTRTGSLKAEEKFMLLAILPMIKHLKQIFDKKELQFFMEEMERHPEIMSFFKSSGNSDVRQYLFFNQVKNERNFFQRNLGEILRQNKLKVEYQAQIGDGFDVDLLVNDKIVIQSHGPDHYVTDEHGNFLRTNLHTHIKELCIQKMGYEIISINLLENKVSQSVLASRIIERLRGGYYREKGLML